MVLGAGAAAGADDALGLLAGGGGGGGGGDDEPPAKKAKNEQLKHWELPPSQLLNPMGQSGVGRIALKSLWTLLCAGGDRSMYYCNLCSEQPTRRRVGLSQLSQVMMDVCNKFLGDNVVFAVMKEDLLKEVRAECTDLLPHFTKLNQGKTSSGGNGKQRLKAAAYDSEDVSRPPDGELEVAASAIHAWLAKPESKLRAAMAALSAGGVFFVGQCHEKAARAFVHHGGGTREAMQIAAKSAVGEGLVGGVDDAAGLGGA